MMLRSEAHRSFTSVSENSMALRSLEPVFDLTFLGYCRNIADFVKMPDEGLIPS